MPPTQHERSKLIGWGADRAPESRPGVPAEIQPPRPIGNAHWAVPEHQVSFAVPLVGHNRRLTPVYSTKHPPRGLSGALRRAAYRVPDYRSRRWLLLMLADRIDVLEHNAKPLAKLLGGVAALAVAVWFVRGMRNA